METFHHYWRLLHIVAGGIGLVAFWIPIATKKGGRVHRGAGLAFYCCVWIVAGTATISALWALLSADTYIGPSSERDDPREWVTFKTQVRFGLSMLGTLALSALSFTVVARHALLAHAAKQPLRRKPIVALVIIAAAAALLFAASGIFHALGGRTTFATIAIPLGVFLFLAQLPEYRYLTDRDHEPFAWWFKHMEGMIGAGIAFHTAFFVFGARRLIGDYLSGPWQLLPWLLPGVVGAIAMGVWTSHYRKKFAGKFDPRNADGSPREDENDGGMRAPN